MSAPDQPGSPGLDQPTREQLDELEALMQRMLALPVSQLEEVGPSTNLESGQPQPQTPDGEAATPPPGAGQEHTPGLPTPKMAGANPGAEKDAVPCDPPSGTFYPVPFDLQTEKEESLSPSCSPIWTNSLALPLASPKGSDAKPTARAWVKPAANSGGLFVAGWLRPLLWINQGFDGCTAWMGPIGRWLRGSTSRALFGWTGVCLLLAALAWLLLDLMDWTW